MDRKKKISMEVNRDVVSAFLTVVFMVTAMIVVPADEIDGVMYIRDETTFIVVSLIPVVYVLFTYILKRAQNYKLVSHGYDGIMGKLSDWAIYKKVLSYISAFWFSLFFTTGMAVVKTGPELEETPMPPAFFVLFIILAVILSFLFSNKNKKEKQVNIIEPVESVSQANRKIFDCESNYAEPKASVPEESLTAEEQFSQYGGVDADLLTIDTMEGHDFEYWTADMLRDQGFNNVSVTRGSGDQGVDVLAEKEGIKYAIQCKRYSSNLGNTPVQEVYAGKSMYHCHVGVVLTNQYFTQGAKELAGTTGVLLWDRDYLRSYLEMKHESGSPVQFNHRKRFCTHCGSELLSGAKFCQNCGSKV